MLTDVLDATNTWKSRLIVTSDIEAASLGRSYGCRVVEDPGTGLNEAIETGTAAALALGCTRLMVLAADVPLVTGEVVEELLSFNEQVVIAPSLDGGTNALVRRPPDVISPAYGPASAEAHRKLAHAAGLEVRTLESGTMMLDIDHVEDLLHLAEQGGRSLTVALAKELLELA